MFGIGISELMFILFIVLMLFGSDKIPEIARTLGKTMKQIKHATNDIKSEIQKSAADSGLSKDALLGDVTKDFEAIKKDVIDSVNPTIQNTQKDIEENNKKIQDSLDELSGPIKRQS
uniref:twin-arginine translocase TatA/TatE family subunit n=1 Tax=Flavobacterium sp. TaxID=239 RepID=UPI00404B3562